FDIKPLAHKAAIDFNSLQVDPSLRGLRIPPAFPKAAALIARSDGNRRDSDAQWFLHQTAVST
ncbi:hypothetical protein, partial [Enterobacter hormaechei]|uniref:hypothetical protein n=1 Tax=Enterobacter hormaechei TaxID=158836 RepID=UPI00197AAA4E